MSVKPISKLVAAKKVSNLPSQSILKRVQIAITSRLDFLTPAKEMFKRFIGSQNTTREVSLAKNEYNEIKKVLSDWEGQTFSFLQEAEERRKTTEIISGYLNNPSEFLSIKTEISSLPDTLFSFSVFKSLKSLELKCVGFVPESVGDLESLNHLDLSGADFVFLPESIGKLKKLQSLNLADSKRLRFLPRSIGELTNLSNLNLHNTALWYFPDSFEKLVNLKILSLGCTKFERLPEYLKTFQNLESLSLAIPSLKILPDWIGELEKLRTLFLETGNFETLPESIGGLTCLERLEVPRTLKTLPVSILQLSSRLTINLYSCQEMTESYFTQLQTSTDVEGYEGPYFIYPSSLSRKDLKSSFEEVYRRARIPKQPLPNLLSIEESQKMDLKRWIQDLSGTADGVSDLWSFEREAFYKAIAQDLKYANDNQQFRKYFLDVINRKKNIGGDGVSLQVVEIGIKRRLFEVDKTDLKAFLNLLKGIYVVELLEKAASDKMGEAVDEDRKVFIKLGYFTKLKDFFLENDIHLSIDVTSMTWFSKTKMTDEDIEKAKKDILHSLKDKEATVNFLCAREDWLDAIKSSSPKESASPQEFTRQLLA